MSNKQIKPAATQAPAATQQPAAIEQTNAQDNGATGDNLQDTGAQSNGQEGAQQQDGAQGADGSTDKIAEGGDGDHSGDVDLKDDTTVTELNIGLGPAPVAFNLGLADATITAPAPLATASPEAEAAPADENLPGIVKTFEEKMVDLHANGTDLTQSTITYLNMYVEAMHPRKPENIATFSQQQVSLWNTIYRAIETEEDFHKNFTILLDYFREHGESSGVFHPYNNFRGLENAPLDKDTSDALQKVCTLLQVVSGTKDISKVRLNVSASLSERLFSNDARNRVLSYLQR